ncbi:MAG: MBL fold metallo-hydrolase [Anaerolineae bacterium]|nr:MBL fold metallo-hydrolase [Anaerolineae bacterium]
MRIERIPVRGTNCYLLQGTAGVMLIDPGPPGSAPVIIDKMTSAGIPPEQVRLILITHGHLDHYGGAPAIKAWCGAPVVAHPIAPGFSQKRRNALPPAQTLQGSIVRWIYLLFSPLARFAPLQADLLLDEGASLSSYGLDAQLVAMPGHAPGSLAVVTGDGDILVGDLFVNYTVPSQPIYLSDRQAWRQSCERVRGLKPRTIYVGHGDPFPGDKLDQVYPARYQFRWWVR